jgi:hypothetical protein
VFIALIPLFFAGGVYLAGGERLQREAAIHIALWSVATWPFLATLAKPKQLLALIATGPFVLLAALIGLINPLQANPDVVYDILVEAPFYLTDDGLIIVQIVLFAVDYLRPDPI